MQPVFEEMRAFTGRGDDRFLSVQQVNNAQDKKTQLLDSNNRNNIVYRLGVSTPETAFALIADMKNPDISWDEISSKYQLGQDLSQGDIANRRSQYTTEELLGSVVRQIQRQ